jgi:hypothetical protein
MVTWRRRQALLPIGAAPTLSAKARTRVGHPIKIVICYTGAKGRATRHGASIGENMSFDKAWWFLVWLIVSAVLWWPIARHFHTAAFRRGWIAFTIIWWLPIAIGETLRIWVDTTTPK